MRNFIIILLAIVLLLDFTTALYAKTPADKLARGMANVVTGFLEVPQTMGEEWKESNNAAIGCAVGAVKGLVLGLARTLSGIWDLLTFPTAIPADYEALYKPDYVFDKE